MANLNKLLVHVPLALCEGFKEKYVKDTDRRDRSYDNKVVFLEDTQEIFTQGKLYGTNVTDFNELRDIVGTIPADAVSNNIVDYITELINKADYIKSVNKKNGEKFIAADTDENNNVTIYSTNTLNIAVNNANNAIKELKLLDKTLDKTNNILTVEEAKSYLGLGTAAYNNEDDFATPSYVKTTYNNVIGKNIDDKTAYTIYGTRAYASYVASDAARGVVDKFPAITYGGGIRVSQETVNGKTTYTISTSAEVFHYKGNKTSVEQLPASDNTTGDVWSVGPADAEGSTLYTWDGDEWINIGGPNGVTDVDETKSYGVKLHKNPDGTVKVIVADLGSVKSGNNLLITGGTAYTAIEEAKTLCYSYTYSYVGGLENSYTSKNGNYVNVKVDTTGGNVSYVAVTETKALTDAVNNANSAMQKVTILSYEISNGGEITADQVKKSLGLKSAAYEETSYFDKADTAQNLINGLGGSATSTNGTLVNVKVETSKGEASKVTVIESDTLKNAVNGGIQTINGKLPYLDPKKNGTTVNLNFDETEVFNYVSSNIWETYSA